MSLSDHSAIAFSKELLKTSEAEQIAAVEALQEYLAGHSNIWRPEKGDGKIFENALAWKPLILEGEFNPAAEKLHEKATVGQVKDIVKLGFTVFTPI